MSQNGRGIFTVQQHIIEGQRAHPTASGEFSWLLSGITLATKIIAAQVRRAGLIDILGATDVTNVQGETVQRLDQVAHETIMRCLGYRQSIGILVSEEESEPRILKEAMDAESGKWIVLFDPLDGSSNIDVNVSIGTIFSILQRRSDVPAHDINGQILQPGYRQVAAGYVLYGGSTILAYTTGHGVHMFTLDPAIGAYVLHEEHVRIPDQGKIYSVNEAYRDQFPDGVQRYLDACREDGYTLRYIGSLVADFHRTLLRGGIFLYPRTKKDARGKLRLLYEANPMAFLAEQAGGAATDGTKRILDIEPTDIHQRTPLIIGSRQEVDRVATFCAK